MKPKSLLLVLILGWLAVAVTAIVALIVLINLLNASSTVANLQRDYGIAVTNGVGATRWIFWVFGLATVALLAVGQFMVTQKRKDLGRWLFVGGAGGYLLLQIVVMAVYGGGGAIDILLFIIALGLMVATAVFLFMPDMNVWLGKPGLSGMMSGYGPGPSAQPGGGQPQGGWGAPPAAGGYQPMPGQPASDLPYAAPPSFAGADPAQPTGYPPVQSGTDQPPQGAPASYDPSGTGAAPPSMRACPYCAEPIRAEAVKCRYCGSEVTPTAP